MGAICMTYIPVGHTTVVPGLAVCKHVFYMFVNVPTIQELFPVLGNVFLKKNR